MSTLTTARTAASKKSLEDAYLARFLRVGVRMFFT